MTRPWLYVKKPLICKWFLLYWQNIEEYQRLRIFFRLRLCGLVINQHLPGLLASGGVSLHVVPAFRTATGTQHIQSNIYDVVRIPKVVLQVDDQLYIGVVVDGVFFTGYNANCQ